jgi:hypothetical protein
MKNAGRSAKLKPVSNDFARDRRVTLYFNRAVIGHQNTVEDGIAAEQNFAAGPDNIEQNLVPLQSGEVNLRIAFQQEFFANIDDERGGRCSLKSKRTVLPKNKIFQT